MKLHSPFLAELATAFVSTIQNIAHRPKSYILKRTLIITFSKFYHQNSCHFKYSKIALNDQLEISVSLIFEHETEKISG